MQQNIVYWMKSRINCVDSLTKPRQFLTGLGFFVFLMILSCVSYIDTAEAFSQVCEPAAVTAPLPSCYSVPDGSAVFPPGTTAPSAGNPFDSVWVPTIPTADTTLAAFPFPNPPLYPLAPAAALSGAYGAGPFYGVDIVPGAPGSNPPSALNGGTGPFPSVVATAGAMPRMPIQNWCGWPLFAFCGTITNTGLTQPVDPIIFIGDGTARMVPIGTQVIKPGIGLVQPLSQQGIVSAGVPLVSVSIVAGDIVVPTPTHTGCPREYNADGTFTCMTYADVAAIIAQIGPPPGVTPPPAPTGAGLLPAICDIGTAVLALSGSFGADPCDLSADVLGLGFAQLFEGGEQFDNFVDDWWANTMLPDMQDMTDQWNTAIIDETRMLGDFANVKEQTEDTLSITQQEINATKRLRPSENTCSMASVAQGVQKALQTSRAMKSALLQESAARALNLPGSGTENGPQVDQVNRWQDYCAVFADAGDNGGFSGCGAPGALPGGDVNVERFLFRDTIDRSNQNERAAADAILRNLVDLKTQPALDPKVMTSAQGENEMLRRTHLATLRQAVVEPVAGIIARRSAIPNSGYELAVRDMRTAAGVPLAEVGASPSYNEAMQARSKEYFMNLDTLLKTGNDLGEIRQDQVVNEALISMTLQDISELEAQINTILQARSSVKFNQAEKGFGNSLGVAPK